MGVSVSRSDLKTRARQRADMENTDFIGDTELDSYIRGSYAAYYDLLVKAYGEDYFSKTDTFTTTSDTEAYNLASDFYKVLLVELKISNNRYVPLLPFEFTDINRVVSTLPGAGKVVRYTYVPVFSNFANDADTKDFVNGWDEFVVVDTALKMKDKEESDVSVLKMERDELTNRIISTAPDRDSAYPDRVQDVSTYDWQSELNNLPGYRQPYVYNSMRYRIRGDQIFLRGL